MKETKVYVNELPKSCSYCPCFDVDNDECNITDCPVDYIGPSVAKPDDCPLIDIKAHDRELVKEVCEKISTELENETETYCEIRQCSSPHYQGDYVWFNYVKFGIFIAQILKEFEK